jgi:hypothetical protein
MQMRGEMREYVRTELKSYTLSSQFVDYKVEHEKYSSDRIIDIQRQLSKAEVDRLRMEAKVDHLLERIK